RSMGPQEFEDAAREFGVRNQIVSRPPDHRIQIGLVGEANVTTPLYQCSADGAHAFEMPSEFHVPAPKPPTPMRPIESESGGHHIVGTLTDKRVCKLKWPGSDA